MKSWAKSMPERNYSNKQTKKVLPKIHTQFMHEIKRCSSNGQCEK